jgi:phosphate transport system protein
MSELQQRLEKMILRLDTMGMRVEQALVDALRAIEEGDIEAGKVIDQNDRIIDREEVEIEQDCIRLLALYQPAAVDLRMVCTIIKVNSDLERIADLAAGMGRRVRRVVEDEVNLDDQPGFRRLAQQTLEVMGRTVRMLSVPDAAIASRVIETDQTINQIYKETMQAVLERHGQEPGGTQVVLTMMNLAKALERIGDLCTNIAEDIIFLRTGDIVRHQQAIGHKPT